MQWAYRKLKTNRKENMTKHVGFVYVYVKKAKKQKSNDEEGGDKQKSKTHTIDNEKQDSFQFVSVWLWSSRCFVHLYIFKQALNTIFRFKFL